MNLKTLAMATIALSVGAADAEPTFEEGFDVQPDVRAKIEPIVSAGGGQVHYFEGPESLIGIGITQLNGQQQVAFATASGDVLIGGVAIDTATNSNMSRRMIEERLPPPDLTNLVDEARNQSVGVLQGNPDSENEFYVFVDPRCGFCQKTYTMFQTLIGEGQDLSVRWIPVGTLGPMSENQASAILGAQDGGDALLNALLNKRQMPVNNEDVARGQAHHTDNIALFRKLKFRGVPATISSVAGAVAVTSGMPKIESLRAQLSIANNRVAQASEVQAPR